MSDSETTDNNARTGLMESPSDEPSRSPDGQKIIAELRARATKSLTDARQQVETAKQFAALHWIENNEGVIDALQLVLMWLDELSGCDTESQREAGTPNT